MSEITIKSAQFIKSAALVSQLPDSNLPEFAFLGRSNVGKSSLLNILTNQKKLAKSSKTPGRTRLLNYFELTLKSKQNEKYIEKNLVFIDLPGYGYAKMSKSLKSDISDLLDNFLSSRDKLKGIFFLFDIRRLPNEEDKLILDSLLQSELEVYLVITKADKMPKSKIKPTAVAIAQAFDFYNARTHMFVTSINSNHFGHLAILEALNAAL